MLLNNTLHCFKNYKVYCQKKKSEMKSSFSLFLQTYSRLQGHLLLTIQYVS